LRIFPVRIHQSLTGIANSKAPSTELSPHNHTLARPANSLGVHSLLPTLMASGPADLVVDFLSKPVCHFLKHARCYILWHQYSFSMVSPPLGGVCPLLGSDFKVLVIFFVIITLLLGQLELSNTPSSLHPKSGFQAEPIRLQAALQGGLTFSSLKRDQQMT